MIITINNVYWRILFVEPNNPFLINYRGAYTVGSCYRDSQTIYIANNLQERFFKKVLCHELVHAAMFSYNVILDIDMEERVADLIATYGEEIIYFTNYLFQKITHN